MKINKYTLVVISARLVCNAATPCPVSLNICNKVRTDSSFCSICTGLFGCGKMYKLISYTVYKFKTHVHLSQQRPTAVIVWVLALRATMINWTDSCSDSTEPPGSLHLIKFTIYCKIGMGLFSLYALFLALWCWCLYIYTVWLVYCAIVLHVWNKLEWAWRTWTWAHHPLYFIRHRQYYTKYDINSTQSQ